MTRSLFPGYRQKQQQQNDDHSNWDYHQREQVTQQQLRDVTIQYLTQMEDHSALFCTSTQQIEERVSTTPIAQLESQEVQLGNMLGMGEYGALLNVLEIKLLHTIPNTTLESPSLGERRPASSALDLCAADDDDDSDQILSQHFDHTATVDATQLTQHRYDMTQSITIAKLAHPGPLSMQQRESIKQRAESVLSRSVAKSEDAAEAQLLREKLYMQVSAPTKGGGDGGGLEDGAPSMHLRLALKQVRKDLYPKKKLQAAKDLAREAKILSRLRHDNIIRLRGVVSQPGTLDFGLLLDRLGTTLSEEVQHWHQRQDEIIASIRTPVVTPVVEALSSLFQRAPSSSNDANSTQQALDSPEQTHQHFTRSALCLLGERILALWDVAKGMRYLHQHKILFRDLKTENVGSLIEDSSVVWNHRMQIFDFGLAKECKAVDIVVDDTKNAGGRNLALDYYNTYRMTGLTGTLRIMAPEVIQCLPYGLPADVYSFGGCLWEVFSGTKDNLLTAAEICKGARPVIPVIDRNSGAGMPASLQSLLHQCWAQDPRQRLTFGEVERRFHHELVEIQKRQHQQQSTSTSRNSSRNNSLANSRSSSPLRSSSGWSSGEEHSQQQRQSEKFSRAAAQAAFWKRMETIHSSSSSSSFTRSTILDDAL